MLSAEKAMKLHKEAWMSISKLLKEMPETEYQICDYDQTAYILKNEIKTNIVSKILVREGIKTLRSNCFLCQYSIEHFSKCLGTKNGECLPPCLNGLYSKFLYEPDRIRSSEIAEQIANLPMNKI